MNDLSKKISQCEESERDLLEAKWDEASFILQEFESHRQIQKEKEYYLYDY